MKCIKCKEDMKLEAVNDDPNRGFAYNVFQCIDCIIVVKKNVWKNKGCIWIFPDNNILSEDYNND